MKHIIIGILSLLCLQSMEAQVKLRVASWNIEELNWYKSKGLAYTQDLNSNQKMIKSAVQDATAGEVISAFMVKNEIDLLFIQEFTPFTLCSSCDNLSVAQIMELRNLDGLDSRFVTDKMCYYNRNSLLVGFENMRGYRDETDIRHPIKKDKYQNNYKTTPYGECYFLIYNKDKVEITRSKFEDSDNPQFKSKYTTTKIYKNDKIIQSELADIRPPVMTEIKLKQPDNTEFKFLNHHRLSIYNYHGKNETYEVIENKGTVEKTIVETDNRLPEDFNDLNVKLNANSLSINDETYGSIIFLGDMNKKRMKNAIEREVNTAAIDYIYANAVATNFVSSKVKEVQSVMGKSINNKKNPFYTSFYKEIENKDNPGEYNIVGGSKTFSDHNPIYVELIFGGKMTAGKINASQIFETQYEKVEKFYYTDNIKLKIKHDDYSVFLDEDLKNYKGKVRLNRPDNNNFPYDARLDLYKKDTVMYWKEQTSGRLDGKTILNYFGKKDTGKWYKFYFTFTFNNFWEIQKEIRISIPSADPATKSTSLRASNLDASGDPLVKTRSFMNNKGKDCKQPGDEVWIVGKCFIKGTNVQIRIPGKVGYTIVDGAKDIDEEGNFKKFIGYGNDFAIGTHIANFYVEDKLVANTEFTIVPCTTQKDLNDDDLQAIHERQKNGKFLPETPHFNRLTRYKIVHEKHHLLRTKQLGKLAATLFMSEPNIDLLRGGDRLILAEIPLSGKVHEHYTFVNNPNTAEDSVLIKKDTISIKISGTEEQVFNYLEKKLGDSPLILITKNDKGEFEFRRNHKVDSEAFDAIFKKPVAYKVRGTATYNPEESGRAVSLEGSETGVAYQLKNRETNVGTLVHGTGSALIFGYQTAGTYTVVATRTSNGVTATMEDSAVVTLIKPQNIHLVPNPTNNRQWEYKLFKGIMYDGSYYFGYSISSGTYRLAKYDGNAVTVIDGNYFGGNFEGGLMVYKNALYFRFRSNTGQYKLAKYDGNFIRLIANPDEGEGFAEGIPVAYNNSLYFPYRTVGGGLYKLAKYDGQSVSLVTNPTINGGLTKDPPIVYKGNLYCWYETRQFYGHHQLAKYDGNSMTLIANPDNSEGVSPGYPPFVYKDNLYFLYRSLPGVGADRLAKYDGNSIIPINNPDSRGGIGSDYIIYKDNLYLSYANQLATFDGNSFKLIPNPTTDGGVDHKAFKTDNDNLYLIYKSQLAKYDGKSITVIPTPEGYYDANQLIVHNDGLYLLYNIYGKYTRVLAQFDGTSVRVFKNPGNNLGIYSDMIKFNDAKLVMLYNKMPPEKGSSADNLDAFLAYIDIIHK